MTGSSDCPLDGKDRKIVMNTTMNKGLVDCWMIQIEIPFMEFKQKRVSERRRRRKKESERKRAKEKERRSDRQSRGESNVNGGLIREGETGVLIKV